jgi:hypothetical protein
MRCSRALKLVASTSRIARNQGDAHHIRDRLNYHGCRPFTLLDGEIDAFEGTIKGLLDEQQRKELMHNIKRGQRGRVAEGCSPASLAYGYRTVNKIDERGRSVRGLREIDVNKAEIVRRIFTDYANGQLARAIAETLNAEGVPSPLGGKCKISTITGGVRRGDGLLRNRLYAGELVHNRTSKLSNGTDPSEIKRAANLYAKQNAAPTFKAVGDEYLDKCAKEERAAITIKKSRWLLSLMEAKLGTWPVADITSSELLGALRIVESKGQLESARRMLLLADRVFRYAIATSRATNDPTGALRGALTAPTVSHHSAILEPSAVGELLRAIDGFNGQPLTCIALQLSPHVYVRPGELRKAEWDEFDLDKAVWTIPAAKMKMRDPHVVPLSRQSLLSGPVKMLAQAVIG